MLRRFLDALDEPALLVTPSGTIRHANGAAQRLLEPREQLHLAGHSLAEFVADSPEDVTRLLRRFSGTSRAVIGRLHLRSREGSLRKCQCRGCRVVGSDQPAEEVLLLVRLDSIASARFRLLTEKIVALNAEIRRNKRIQLQLETALDQKETLLLELHHRVKNNLQTLLSILSLAERRSTVTNVREVIGDVRLRIEALAVLQRLLYADDHLSSINGSSFLEQLCANVERAFGRHGIAVQVRSSPISLSLDVASAVGLIVNELLTNAFKHAFADRQTGHVSVWLSQEQPPEGKLVLVVADDGRGFDPDQAAGTGWMLVRGFAQQQGGTCVIETASNGVRCTITLGVQHGRSRPN